MRATHGSPEKQLSLGDRNIQCYVLQDGTAVLSGRGLTDALNLDEKAIDGKRSQSRKLDSFFNNKQLKPFIDADLARRIESPIRFTRPGRGGTVAKGYEAITLTQICRTVLKARREDAFKDSPQMQRIADECEIIIAAFSDIGIIATIYEVTGYERDKAVDAYQQYLEKFIRKEAAKYVEQFPIEFFELMCDLKGWPYEKGVTKYYQAMGHVINDVIYSRLAPGILNEIDIKNPRILGKRKTKKYNWLTVDLGLPQLNAHLSGVMTLAKANTTWRKFCDQMARVFPVHNDPTIYLFPPDQMDDMAKDEE